MYANYLSKCFEIGTRLGLENEKTIAVYKLLELYEKTKSAEIGNLIDRVHKEVIK